MGSMEDRLIEKAIAHVKAETCNGSLDDNWEKIVASHKVLKKLIEPVRPEESAIAPDNIQQFIEIQKAKYQQGKILKCALKSLLSEEGFCKSQT